MALCLAFSHHHINEWCIALYASRDIRHIVFYDLKAFYGRKLSAPIIIINVRCENVKRRVMLCPKSGLKLQNVNFEERRYNVSTQHAGMVLTTKWNEEKYWRRTPIYYRSQCIRMHTSTAKSIRKFVNRFVVYGQIEEARIWEIYEWRTGRRYANMADVGDTFSISHYHSIVSNILSDTTLINYPIIVLFFCADVDNYDFMVERKLHANAHFEKLWMGFASFKLNCSWILLEKAQKKRLEDPGIPGHTTTVQPEPVVTKFELQRTHYCPLYQLIM